MITAAPQSARRILAVAVVTVFLAVTAGRPSFRVRAAGPAPHGGAEFAPAVVVPSNPISPPAPPFDPFDPFDPTGRAKLDVELVRMVTRATLRGAAPGSPGSRLAELLAEPIDPQQRRMVLHQSPPHRSSAIRVIVESSDRQAAEAAGLKVRAAVGDVFAGTVTAGRLDDLARVGAVRSIHAPALSWPKNDFGRLDARQPEAVQATGRTGKGVLVGIIDSGIDWTHPSFRNPDGSTRIAALLDLAYPGDHDNDGILDGDPDFGGGTVYRAAEINAALRGGNGLERRMDGIEQFAGGSTQRFPIELPTGTVPSEGVAVQLHIAHRDYANGLGTRLIGPDNTVYDQRWQAQGGGLLQATVVLQGKDDAPLVGRDIGGRWQLEVTDTDASDGGGWLVSWALLVDRKVYEEDLNGHGTHVSGTAAGNGGTRSDGGSPYAGMAPGAELLVVRAERDLASFAEDDEIVALAWIDEVARRMGRPWVANMSLGGHYGPHDGSRPDERAIDHLTASGGGAAVVVAAGNEGLDDMHRTGTWGADAVPLAAISPTGDAYAEVEGTIWYAGSSDPVLRWSAPSQHGGRCVSWRIAGGSTTDPLDDCDRLDRFAPGDTIYWQFLDSVSGGSNVLTEGTLIWAGEGGPGHGAVSVQMVAANGILDGEWHLGLLGSGGGTWHAWQEGCMPFLGCDNAYTIGSPGTAAGAITVAAHTTRVAWTDTRGNSRGLAWWDGRPVAIDLIAPFSSVGPAADGRPKPDLSAPGLFISSALSASAWPCPYGDLGGLAYCREPESWEARLIAHDYIISQGTSMAAPMVTGAVALLEEDRPSESASQIKDRLRNGARRDTATGNPPDAPLWGAGKLDLVGALGGGGGGGGPCPVVGVEVSSVAGPGWEREHLIDGQSATVWSSRPHGEHLASAEWAALVLPRSMPLDSVRVMPRPNFKDADHAEGFPKDLVIQYSFDGERRGRQLTCNAADLRFRDPANWVPVTTRNGYAQPASRWQSFALGVEARCVRLFGTELSQDGFGNRYLQLAEMQLLSGGAVIPNAAPVASSAAAHPMWMVSNLADGDPVTTWSSVPHGEHLASSEWVSVLLRERTVVNSVLIHPRANPNDLAAADGFPKDFVVQYAFDGEHRGRMLTCDPEDPRFAEVANWIPVATRTNFAQPRGDWLAIDIPPSNATCLRIYGTDLSQDGFGNRYFQLSEILPTYDGKGVQPVGAVASSALPDARWDVAHVVDGSPTTTWSSAPHSEHLAESEWAAVLLPQTTDVSSVVVQPRISRAGEPAEGFPKDFILQYAFTGPYRDRTLTCDPHDVGFQEPANWIPLTNRVGFGQPATGAPLPFVLGRTVQAGCVRLLATELSQDGFGLRYLQLSEIRPWSE